MSVHNFVKFLILCYHLTGISVCLKNRRKYNYLVLKYFIIFNCNMLQKNGFFIHILMLAEWGGITLLFSFLSGGCPKHNLTRSANKNDPTFSLVLYPTPR